MGAWKIEIELNKHITSSSSSFISRIEGKTGEFQKKTSFSFSFSILHYHYHYHDPVSSLMPVIDHHLHTPHRAAATSPTNNSQILSSLLLLLLLLVVVSPPSSRKRFCFICDGFGCRRRHGWSGCNCI